MGPALPIVYAIGLLVYGGAFFFGFMLGRWRRKRLGLALAFLPHVIFATLGVANTFQQAEMGYIKGEEFLWAVLASAVFSEFLILSLAGYALGFVLSRRKR